MRKPLIASAILLSLTAAVLTGCSLMDPGPAATQDRPIDEVTAVELDTSGTLTVTLGESTSLSVTAGEKLIDHLTTETDDGVLYLGIEGDPPPYTGSIRYELTVPTLDAVSVFGSGHADVNLAAADDPALTLKGSGSIRATGASAESMAITLDGSGVIDVDMDVDELIALIDGSGGVRATGSSDEQVVELHGSGGYTADELQSVDARVLVRGSGEATVSASGSLDAELDGSGGIRYLGDPVVTERVSGSGHIGAR